MPNVFCCPKCGNKNLLSTTETKTQTHGKNYSAGQGCLGFLLFGPLGLLCGGCGQSKHTTSTNTTYWICPDCGYKFENPDDIRQKIRQYQTPVFVIITITGIIAAILMYSIIGDIDKSLGTLYAWIVAIACTIAGAIAQKAQNTERDRMFRQLYEIENGMKQFKDE